MDAVATDFHLTVRGTPGTYTVEARLADGRSVEAPFELDRDERFVETVRTIDAGRQPTAREIQELGERLFDALFPRKVLRAYDRAESRGEGASTLRLRLNVRAPDLAPLPWETLCDDGTFVAERRSRPLVRVLDTLAPSVPLGVEGALHILHAQAAPLDTPELDLDAGRRALEEGVGEAARITRLDETTAPALREALRAGVHVLHYEGHAALTDRGPVLQLHEPEGDGSAPLRASELASYLDGSDVRLVVLAACLTGSSASEGHQAAVAGELVRTTRVPAIVAMNYEVADTAAIAFTRAFYAALVDEPVERALVNGRLAMKENDGSRADWLAPLLFLRVGDGRLFAAVAATPAEDALARLSRMPVGDSPVPALAPLPRFARVPYLPNPLFTGRNTELRTLAGHLRTGRTVAAVGMGGVGKSQLASALVHRYGQFFAGGVFWLSFADPDGIEREIVACGLEGGMELPAGFADLDLKEQLRQVLAVWADEQPRLFVFDDCETPELLREWRARLGPEARVIATARRARWPDALDLETMRLGVFPRAMSVALLRRFRPELAADDPVLDGIAETVGDLPLALQLAGGFLKRYRETGAGRPERYLESLRERKLAHPSLEGRGSDTAATGNLLDVAATFDMGFEALDPDDPIDSLALDLLARAAYLLPGESFPRPLLLQTMPDADELDAEDALARLIELGFLDPEAEGALKMHRLVADYVRARAPDEAAQSAVEDAVLWSVLDASQSGDPRPLVGSEAHLAHVVERAMTREDEEAGGLCFNYAIHLATIGRYAAAEPFCRRALEIFERLWGPDDVDTAAVVNNLALLFKAQGRYAEAHPLYLRALEIRERELGSDHPDTAISVNNLAANHMALGELEAAEPLFLRALENYEASMGPEDPRTGSLLNNLAHIYLARDDFEAAEPMLKRALSIQEQAAGPEHPNTATSLNSLADLYLAREDYATAEPLYEQALGIVERVLGTEHPHAATILSNLAGLYLAQENTVRAAPLYRRALEIREQMLGPAHPYTARSLVELAGLHLAQEDDTAAEHLFLRALAIFEAVLGDEHPETVSCLNDLAELYAARGDFAAAEPLAARAVESAEAVLGPDDPTTETLRANHTLVLDELRDAADPD